MSRVLVNYNTSILRERYSFGNMLNTANSCDDEDDADDVDAEVCSSGL